MTDGLVPTAVRWRVVYRGKTRSTHPDVGKATEALRQFRLTLPVKLQHLPALQCDLPGDKKR